MGNTAQIIRGPWHGGPEFPAPITFRREDGTILEHFPDYASALRFREAEQLGPEWALHDSRGQPAGQDILALVGMVLRDGLKDHWRRAQFDRLLCRDIRQVPKRGHEGLEAASAACAARALEAADQRGWTAMAGSVTRAGSSVAHAWLEHEDGSLLDFMADRLTSAPIVTLLAEQRGDAGYAAHAVVEAPYLDDWAESLISPLKELLPKAEPDVSLDF